jgi:hypothetical protein
MPAITGLNRFARRAGRLFEIERTAPSASNRTTWSPTFRISEIPEALGID